MEKASKCLRIALIQLKVGMDKTKNVTRAVNFIRQAVAEHQPKIIALPECFNSPYGTKHFKDFAEEIPNGYTSNSLSNIAKELGVYIIGGTIPEVDVKTSKIYNTCTIWSPNGSLMATYRKIHLFDINVEGGIKFKESDVLTGGNKLVVVEVENVKIGIGICYDMRFGELARIYRQKGCDLIFYPGAFNMTTGPLHWELLQRGRALDNQIYVATISPARDETAEYIAYGHSMIVDPWAKIVKSADETEQIVVADIGNDF